MSNNTSLLAYGDCREAMDKALVSSKGIKVSFAERKEAYRFLSRCNSFRVLDRRENCKIYLEPAHSLHGRSVYDTLLIKQRDTVVLILPRTLSEATVEFL